MYVSPMTILDLGNRSPRLLLPRGWLVSAAADDDDDDADDAHCRIHQ